ncbi:MAG: alpha/beta fold hydrolase [Actinomycetota bacterium]|nr:alpha/beta fold hydrolase [Actinomycetota bacterium]
MIQYPQQFGGVVTRVLESGSGDENMVLIHGVAARADRWRSNLEPLGAAGYHVYAPDLPGHGLAEKGSSFVHSVPNYAAAVNGFLDEIDAERVVLIGTSLGGHVAATAACDRPERVSALVLVGTVGIVALGDERRANTSNRLASTSEEGIRSKLSVLMHDSKLATEDFVQEEWKINSSPGAADSFAGVAKYFGEKLDDDVVGERLRQLSESFPTLVVWGREDVGIPLDPVGFQTHEALPGSTLALIDDTAHAPYYERPDAFNQIVLEFLGGTLGQSSITGVELR